MFRSTPSVSLFLLPALVLLLTGCAGKGPFGGSAPQPGDLLLPNGAAVGDGDVVRRAYAADYILIGEQHDNPLHHQVQARLIRALAGLRPAVGLEMVAAEQNPTLERFNRGELGPDALAEALDWPKTWGFPFALYRPIFETLAEEKIPVRGLNVPRRVLDSLRRAGMEGLPAKDRALLPDPVLFPSQARREELAEFFRTHEAMRRRKASGAPSPSAGSGTFERFILVQSIWDTGMAREAARLRTEHGTPIIILAGNGHVEDGTGIADRLRQIDPGARIVLISPAPRLNKEELRGADYYYYAPPTQGGRLGLSLLEEGGTVLVRAVAPGSPAERAGVKAGDRILSVAGKPVAILADLHKAAAGRERGAPLAVRVLRGERNVDLELRP